MNPVAVMIQKIYIELQYASSTAAPRVAFASLDSNPALISYRMAQSDGNNSSSVTEYHNSLLSIKRIHNLSEPPWGMIGL